MPARRGEVAEGPDVPGRYPEDGEAITAPVELFLERDHVGAAGFDFRASAAETLSARNGATHVKKDLGQQFIDWLVSPEGQKAIADYKINGEQLFYPNANDPNA
jgi:hypothetical protein